MAERERERFEPGDDGRPVEWPPPRPNLPVEPAERWARNRRPDDQKPDWPWLKRRRGRRAYP